MSEFVELLHAKLARADQHIQEFQVVLSAFYATNSYRVEFKEDPKSGNRIYFVAHLPKIPLELATIAANVFQDLRDPLDHVANELVLAANNGQAPKKGKIYFPIAGSASDYPATRKGVIKGVRQEIIDAFDATEPYPRGKGHALWQLNELNKIQKHHRLIAATGRSGVDISPDINRSAREMTAQHPPFEVTIFGPFFVSELVPLTQGYHIYIEPLKTQVEKNRKFSFEVAFHEPGIAECEPALKLLRDLANFVRSTISAFESFFA